MAAIRYPEPLRPGDRVGVTSPSAGVDDAMRARFAFAIGWLLRHGFEVTVGDCVYGAGVVSAPAVDRAEELMDMLLDPEIRAIVPPWGGELAVEILPYLDFEAIAEAPPTWVVGFSDMSTLLVPLTTLTGTATLYGQNLMDTPNTLPDELLHWTEAAAHGPDRTLRQSATRVHASRADFRYRDTPTMTAYPLDEPGGWRLLAHGEKTVDVRGRLIGGCIETLATIAGSPYGNVASFARNFAPEGLIVYVEASESHAIDIARGLWSMRLAGWFDAANAVLIGRTYAPEARDFSQDDALLSALGELGIPLIADVDCGHVVPQLSLINGASAHVVLDGVHQTIAQTFD